MKKFSHIVNLVDFPAKSDLYTAQQVTMETMRIARGFSADTVDVTLLSAQYPEDRKVVPEYFIATRDLEQSVLDVANFNVRRKLPLVKDILDRAYDTAPDYIIFTNVDIGLLPNFYTSVSNLIDSGFDSFIINRRTISKVHTRVEDIPRMYTEVGQPHMGYDCFVFKRDAYKNFILGLTCVGAAHIGKVVLVNQVLNSNKFNVFRELHVTFHIGNDKMWTSKALKDYEEHNLREFHNIVVGLDAQQRALIRASLSNNRWRGVKNKIARFLKLSE